MSGAALLDTCMQKSKNVQLSGNPKLVEAALLDVQGLLQSRAVVGKNSTRLRARKRELEQILERSQRRNPEKIIEKANGLLQLASGMIQHSRKRRSPEVEAVHSNIAMACDTIHSLTEDERNLFAGQVSRFWQTKRSVDNDLQNSIRKRVKERRGIGRFNE